MANTLSLTGRVRSASAIFVLVWDSYAHEILNFYTLLMKFVQREQVLCIFYGYILVFAICFGENLNFGEFSSKNVCID